MGDYLKSYICNILKPNMYKFSSGERKFMLLTLGSTAKENL